VGAEADKPSHWETSMKRRGQAGQTCRSVVTIRVIDQAASSSALQVVIVA